MPSDGMDRNNYLNKKFGSREQASKVYKRIEDEGRLVNIHFQFNKIKKTPNSFLSHKLLAFAFNKHKQNEVLESIFFNYFIEGKDIGNLDTIIEILKTNFELLSLKTPSISKNIIDKERNISGKTNSKLNIIIYIINLSYTFQLSH